MRLSLSLTLPVLFLTLLSTLLSAQPNPTVTFEVGMQQPGEHRFQVTMTCNGFRSDTLFFKMPSWMPGYYQLLHYADNLENFRASDGNGQPLPWRKINRNTWQVINNEAGVTVLSYAIKATRNFVATSFLDEERGYISPTGVFLYVQDHLGLPSTIVIEPNAWKDVATGLESVHGKDYTYKASDFDILYDSPILIGNLESLPPFEVNGIPHRFIGYKLGEFDRNQLVNDLKKIVTASAGIIGEIPYPHYTFIGIGPGRGGIEHLNSTTFGFDGNTLNTRQGRIRMLSFLAHEYFHHYNVKRIRPIELGPFDYDQGSRTNMLWVSEGLTSYYSFLALKRANLITEDELYDMLRGHIVAFENKPGRLFQTLAQASYETWSDGPFGRTDDEINRTISYYDKGPVVGWLLDFAIRQESKNRKSLDDVMRILYFDYYKKKGRGFTEDEFREVVEQTAGKPLPEIFDYVYTLKPLDYAKYLSYAGLSVDTTSTMLEGVYTGFSTRLQHDTLFVTSIDWQMPAMKVGIRRGDAILEIDGRPATESLLQELNRTKKNGEAVTLIVLANKHRKTLQLPLAQKQERYFAITRMPDPTRLQKDILSRWLTEKGVLPR
jgi:predicted metalloprotease with PDZ domain